MGLREFGAMFLDVTYWRTGSVDQALLRDIKAADEALIASNPETRHNEVKNQ